MTGYYRTPVGRALLAFSAAALLSACARQAEPGGGGGEKSKTSSLSSAAIKAAGIETLTVESRSDSGEIRTTGEIKADENKVFHINSMVAGRLTKDNVTLGSLIHEGQVLAVVQNLEVAKLVGDFVHQTHENEVQIEQAKSKLDLAVKNLDRLTRLMSEGIAPQKEVIAAQNQKSLLEIEIRGLNEHKDNLRNETQAMLSAYGVDIDQARKKPIETGSPLRAPRSGVVIQKNVTLGDVVTTTDPLYVVADLSQVWLDIAIFDRDLTSIREGQAVVFTSDSLPGRQFRGKISYIQPAAGAQTRTFLARAVFANPGLTLKPGMFGQVVISRTAPESRPYLPDRAIQKFGDQTFVFVEVAKDSFEKRNVQLAGRLGDGYMVAGGLRGGERVAGNGSFTLKAELLKGQTEE